MLAFCKVNLALPFPVEAKSRGLSVTPKTEFWASTIYWCNVKLLVVTLPTNQRLLDGIAIGSLDPLIKAVGAVDEKLDILIDCPKVNPWFNLTIWSEFISTAYLVNECVPVEEVPNIFLVFLA